MDLASTLRARVAAQAAAQQADSAVMDAAVSGWSVQQAYEKAVAILQRELSPKAPYHFWVLKRQF